ncbi:response regulator [Mariprofundus sp. EBB-1]|uniref:response regulator n=1 Tax=Mariprofundus sp. EBB-1 TaxID=2650971 RepID=UPI000EF255E8|nr:response regulator [Mariprofundus sp. EBB-1]RLL51747.1 response regulator [Mariprofundus sp. EBB-1]
MNSNHSPTVLLVDDDEMLREIGTLILEEIDINVITAINGIDAIELFQQHQDHIDMVLLDLTMPKMGGIECLKRLRALAPELEVLICSGYTEAEVKALFYNDSRLSFIQKPYQLNAMEDKVRHILTGQQS